MIKVVIFLHGPIIFVKN